MIAYASASTSAGSTKLPGSYWLRGIWDSANGAVAADRDTSDGTSRSPVQRSQRWQFPPPDYRRLSIAGSCPTFTIARLA